MHKIKLDLKNKDVRLDDFELKGVRDIKINSPFKGPIEVTLTLVATDVEYAEDICKGFQEHVPTTQTAAESDGVPVKHA